MSISHWNINPELCLCVESVSSVSGNDDEVGGLGGLLMLLRGCSREHSSCCVENLCIQNFYGVPYFFA